VAVQGFEPRTLRI